MDTAQPLKFEQGLFAAFQFADQRDAFKGNNGQFSILLLPGFGNFGAHDRRTFLVRQKDDDAANVLLGPGNETLFEQVHALGDSPQRFLEDLGAPPGDFDTDSQFHHLL